MLSIIIPTLNEEKHLPILLLEVKKQNFKGDLEIIIADAGSVDQTIEIAKKFGCKITKGGLPAKGRNEGAKKAQGEILLFMDADNFFLPPNFFQQLLEKFKKRNLGVASFPIYAQGNKFDKLAHWAYNSLAFIFQNFLPHATNSVLIKKKIHQKIGGFDEEIRLAEEHSYARKAAQWGKFGFIKTKPVLTSARRYEKDGRLKTYLKYFFAGIYLFFLGDIKSDIFQYRFGHFLEKKKKKNYNSKREIK